MAKGKASVRSSTGKKKAHRKDATEIIKKIPPSIIGIGSSAGGLEALEMFLANVPKNCGHSFVIVQHLDPNHKGMMVELLQRSTKMPVVQIKDRMKVEPNHVYVIPPNRDLSILHGKLHLLEPTAPRGLRLPIDHFFRSLADDQQENCIGVILSGMGSDGTLGLRAIKEKAGAVFVQDPEDAKFNGMPKSAIGSGMADVVAPANELPERINAYIQHVPLLVPGPDQSHKDRNHSGLEKVILILRNQTGHDFSLYKKSTIYRRIERRMGLHQIARISDYVHYLRENTLEADLLFKELLIGVTSFFRDPAVWEQLKSEAIPKLLEAHPNGGTLRAWCTGCSTGEEAYSLAIVFREAIELVKPKAHYSLHIFATDLDRDAVNLARNGVFPTNIAADVGEERLKKFFEQWDSEYRVSKEIREMVIFAQQNLVMDPPFTKLDILTCRNLLIYLEPEMQKKILPLFHYSLNPDGILVLGTAETVGQSADLFSQLPGKTRIYMRQNTSYHPERVEFPSAFARRPIGMIEKSKAQPEKSAIVNLQKVTESLLLQHHSPAAVLVNDKGDIIYINGRTGKYLEPAAGKADLNIFAMARDGLRGAMNDAFARAIREKKTVKLHGITVGTNGGTQSVNVKFQYISEPEEIQGMMLIVFKDIDIPDVPKTAGKAKKSGTQDARMASLKQEVRQAKEELRAAREEMQSSREELKSTNEELQSTNEELQSTNEELTTSKEEMQSMNEELQTLNHELQAKVDELSLASDDMKNLLNSTEIATLFLDDKLKVRRFTDQISNIIKLIPGDTGRPFTDIVSELNYPDLEKDVKEVLKTLVFKERQITASKNRWFRVRIMPYRTQNNRIDGVVITFIDITETKNLEAKLREVNKGKKRK